MIKCFTRSWQCLLDCNASILKQYFKNVIFCLLSTWQYDTYLHLYIYNKSFSRYIKKKKKQPPNLTVLITEWPWNAETSPHITMRSLFHDYHKTAFFGMLKTDDGVRIHDYAHVHPLLFWTPDSWTNCWVSSEERVPSLSWFWLCWFLVDFSLSDLKLFFISQGSVEKRG